MTSSKTVSTFNYRLQMKKIPCRRRLAKNTHMNKAQPHQGTTCSEVMPGLYVYFGYLTYANSMMIIIINKEIRVI